MALNFQVVIDCKNPHVLADWWAETLEWIVEPQDEAFIRSMVDQGFATEEETTTHNGKLVWKDGAAIGRKKTRTRTPAAASCSRPFRRIRPSRTVSTGTFASTDRTRTTSAPHWKRGARNTCGRQSKGRTNGTPWRIPKATSSASADWITRL
ncbi:hypothetical protein AHiyo8_45230 [Arthrobacter sp. Hiyo8]|nr:hypothetical protein AHiyo8_45230 [Arthrobacter sp. Hiyo8]